MKKISKAAMFTFALMCIMCTMFTFTACNEKNYTMEDLFIERAHVGARKTAAESTYGVKNKKDMNNITGSNKSKWVEHLSDYSGWQNGHVTGDTFTLLENIDGSVDFVFLPTQKAKEVIITEISYVVYSTVPFSESTRPNEKDVFNDRVYSVASSSDKSLNKDYNGFAQEMAEHYDLLYLPDAEEDENGVLFYERKVTFKNLDITFTENKYDTYAGCDYDIDDYKTVVPMLRVQLPKKSSMCNLEMKFTYKD